MQKLIQITLRNMPVLFWLALSVVTLLMLLPVSAPKVNFSYIDKVEHAFVFLVLAVMGFIAWPPRQRSIILGLAFYGVLTEVAQQIFTTYRQASVGDWLADLAGVILAYIIYTYFVNRGFRLGVER